MSLVYHSHLPRLIIIYFEKATENVVSAEHTTSSSLPYLHNTSLPSTFTRHFRSRACKHSLMRMMRHCTNLVVWAYLQNTFRSAIPNIETNDIVIFCRAIQPLISRTHDSSHKISTLLPMMLVSSKHVTIDIHEVRNWSTRDNHESLRRRMHNDKSMYTPLYHGCRFYMVFVRTDDEFLGSLIHIRRKTRYGVTRCHKSILTVE